MHCRSLFVFVQKHCITVEEAAQLYADAVRLRKQAATGVNAESSRSHAVFTVYFMSSEGLPPECLHSNMQHLALLCIYVASGKC